MVSRFFCLCMVTGCWIGPAEVQDRIDAALDTDTEEAVLHIASVKPNYGPSEGGTTVAIELVEACENAVVHLGGEAAAVSDQSMQQVVVSTPQLQGGQWVDVEVICDGGRAVLEEGFQVFEDASGLVRSAGEFSWVEHIGGYWKEDVEDYGYAVAYVFEPLDFDYGIFYGSAMDRCESAYAADAIQIESMAHLTDTLGLISGQTEIELAYVAESGSYQSVLDPGDFARNIAYELQPFGEVSPWSENGVTDFVQTPSGEMSITAPSMDKPSPPKVDREFDLVWPGAHQGDYILGLIDRYDSFGSVAERVRCLLRDDGAFRVHASVFEGWEKGSMMMIRLGRAKGAEGVFEADGAGSGMVGVYWVMGAGYQG